MTDKRAEHTPLPWRVFDGGGVIGNGGVLAIFSSEKRRNEIIGWPGFDSSDYPKQARAALTLVEKGNGWTIDCGTDDPPSYEATVGKDNGTYEGGWHGAFGATPALALCIAALRARSS
jgi:hypothetical protein